jgi:maltose alpha-D-glucosyltransferase / alpha-amylase
VSVPDAEHGLSRDPTWYKDAVIYQVHVRAFGDSNGDGIGDFIGLTERLDHLVELGVTAVWLLPFYPSPLRDDGYDIADYGGVNPAYGTLRDFRRFLREAHERGLRVITELVLNHTSDAHPWFQRSRRAEPGSRWRDWYVWSDTPDRYAEARIIFEDFESSNWTWDPVAGAYYFHRFFSHQPDLNFENPEVRQTMLRMVDRWLEMGVDGVRLDAVPYLFEREGTNCENLPETHAFLRDLRTHVDANFPDRMLLAEANQWPEDAVAYFGQGDGDECHMAFHFPLMPRLYMAVRMEDRHPLIDILRQTPEIPSSAQWAIFLRNHDELTLEMVTDEERDYMYRAYAVDPRMRVNLGIRRRLAPLMQNDRRKIELLNGLLFALPGTPVIYYGDEIGMGDNVYLGDRDGVRTPMQWSPDRNAGFSLANPQQLYLPVVIDPEYHYESVNVEAQRSNQSSLFNWMRRLVALRHTNPVFGRGAIEFLYPENAKVLAFIRHDGDERILVVANLSRQAQSAHLDLHADRGSVLIELFGGASFPQVIDAPYHLTLGPYDFYWFRLEPQPAGELDATQPAPDLPNLTVPDRWEQLFAGRPLADLCRAMPDMLARTRWFAGRHRQLLGVSLEDTVPMGGNGTPGIRWCLVHADFESGEPDTYVLPLSVATGAAADTVLVERPDSALAWVEVSGTGERLLLVDAFGRDDFVEALPEMFDRRRQYRSEQGADLVLSGTPGLRRTLAEAEDLTVTRVEGAHANTTRIYGRAMVLKVFRRAMDGDNADVEIARYLADRRFPNAPRLLGSLEYQRNRGKPRTIAVANEYVPNEGDAWHYTLDRLGLFIEAVLADPPVTIPPEPTVATLVETGGPTGGSLDVHIGPFLDSAAQLGRRLGELHRCLGAGTTPEFEAEPFTTLWQRSLFQSMRSRVGPTLEDVGASRTRLDPSLRQVVDRVLASGEEIEQRLASVLEPRFDAARIRVHGDLHLGQVLLSGRDWVVIDFEGDPSRPPTERRLKRTSLVDLAGLIRSFDYAVSAAVRSAAERGVLRPEDHRMVSESGRLWMWRVVAELVAAYRAALAGSGIVPDDPAEFSRLLGPLLVDELLRELRWHVTHRPDLAGVSARSLDRLLGSLRL